MGKYPAKVISGGRVTLPTEVREELDLEYGDYVEIEVERYDG